MTRYLRSWKAAGLVVGLTVAAAMALSAGPAGATLVCPPGVTNPNYCTNVPPVATTGKATNVTGTSATLNGTSGPGVVNGDTTVYYFQYGLTSNYGNNTSTGTVGNCPPGEFGPNYCHSPATQAVSKDISGLQPCTVYHYRIVSTNPDGTTDGNDAVFQTGFAAPVKKFHVPHRVKHSSAHHKRHFKIKVSLRYTATLSVTVKGKHYEKTYQLGTFGPGQYHFRLVSPRHRGRYKITLHASMSCGTELIIKHFRVH